MAHKTLLSEHRNGETHYHKTAVNRVKKNKMVKSSRRRNRTN